MFIDIALQDEFINMDFSKQMVLDNKTLKERARLILPKNYRDLINKHEDKHRIQKIWQTLLEGFIYELSSNEINNINNEKDIKDYLDLVDLDLLILEDEISQIFLDDFLRVLSHNEKEACAPSFSAIQKTNTFKKVDNLFRSQKIQNQLIWSNHIRPFIQNAKKVQIIDRHLASYLYGSKNSYVSKDRLDKRKLVKKLLSGFKTADCIEKLDLICEFKEADFKGDIKPDQVSLKLKKLKNALSSDGLNVNFLLGPEKFFQHYFKESSIIIDSKYFMKVDHFGDLFFKPDGYKDIAGGVLNNDFRTAISKISKPYANTQWITV